MTENEMDTDILEIRNCINKLSDTLVMAPGTVAGAKDYDEHYALKQAYRMIDEAIYSLGQAITSMDSIRNRSYKGF